MDFSAFLLFILLLDLLIFTATSELRPAFISITMFNFIFHSSNLYYADITQCPFLEVRLCWSLDQLSGNSGGLIVTIQGWKVNQQKSDPGGQELSHAFRR